MEPFNSLEKELWYKTTISNEFMGSKLHMWGLKFMYGVQNICMGSKIIYMGSKIYVWGLTYMCGV